MFLLRASLAWLIIVAAEFVHGIARAKLLEPHVGDFRARQIAVLPGAAIILITAILLARWIGAKSVYQLVAVGLLWLVLMLGIEIGFGRLVMGYSWERISSDYNLREGGLLTIGMVVLAMAPLIAAKVRRLV